MSNLLYSSDEEDLRASARGILTRYHALELARRSYDDSAASTSLWSALSDLGIVGLLAPEDLGGAGAGPREAAVVLEELGRTVAPVPFLTSGVIAMQVLLSVGETVAETVADLATGVSTAALVLPWSDSSSHWNPVETIIRPVAGALEADVFLIPLRNGADVELRLLGREEVTLKRLPSLDMSRPLAEVTRIGPGRPLATGPRATDAVEAGLKFGQSLLASEAHGVSSWCLESTVGYVKSRVQFGRAIGSFQAIKHRLADLYVEVVQAQAAARQAADTLAEKSAEADLSAAIAKAYCSDVGVHVAEEALQLHGGIAMTWEHDLHLFLKRAKSNQLALGLPSAHRQDVGKLVNLTL